MAATPSVGDILMLSQLAWRIGRAFTQGRKGALQEFTEVEREANGLSEALKLVAEALYSDNNILIQADTNTRHAVSTILDSAHKTLSDLESFVDRYRVIKKNPTRGGFVVERAWSEVVIANYKTVKWTTEGGDLSELRNILHMHTNTMNLTMQALQSRSLARLERTVLPMAENVAAIHDTVNGDLSVKIDDLHRIITAIANSTPLLMAVNENRERHGSVASEEASSETGSSPTTVNSRSCTGPPQVPSRHPGRPTSPQITPTGRNARLDSAYFSMAQVPRGYNDASYQPIEDGKHMDWGFESGSPPPDRNSIGGLASMPPSGSTMVATPGSESYYKDLEEFVPRRESLTVPQLFSTMDDDDGSYSPELARQRTRDTVQYSQNLPPPALGNDDEPRSPATPASYFRARPSRTDSSLSTAGGAARPSTAKSIVKRESKSATPINDDVGQRFEKSLFRNAAILCDVRGSLVEYAQHLPDEPDPRYNTEMVAACKGCRIYVIRKRENQPHGGYKVVSSIWVISDDGNVRLQQRLSELRETVPYCSYFQPEKVSLPPVDASETTLRFHPEVWGDEIVKEARSNWINYIFDTEESANSFQSAIFGRTLLGSFRTTKTTVIHDGLKGAFAFEEQFANIEVLRLWADDGIATHGASGGVLALMHLGSNFGEGWARWWMNSSKQHVRVKDEQTKFAKIKGIDIRTVRPGQGGGKARQVPVVEAGGEAAAARRKALEKRVTGVRIEFKSEEERARFVDLAKRVQERMLPLPDV